MGKTLCRSYYINHVENPQLEERLSKLMEKAEGNKVTKAILELMRNDFIIPQEMEQGLDLMKEINKIANKIDFNKEWERDIRFDKADDEMMYFNDEGRLYKIEIFSSDDGTTWKKDLTDYEKTIVLKEDN